MSVSLSHVDGPGDAELIAAVRGGDVDAYGELFARHVDAARRLARQIAGPSDADDLVSDAFAKVLTVLQRGGGPDLAFRAYLLTAVRRLHVDRIRAGSRLRPVDDLEPFDPGLPFHDTAVEGFDNAAAAKAFASLPERWQMVLWHTEVEQQKPADIAPLLGMSANSVSALAYRAREGLRQAFLSQHAADPDDVDCAWTRDHLGAYVRGGLSRRDAARVDDHLASCRACAAVYLELTEVNGGLAALLAPLLLGSAGAAYLTSFHGTAGLGAAVTGSFAAAKGWVAANTPLTAVGGLAVTATALLAVYGVSHFGGHGAASAGNPPGLDRPAVSASPPAASSPSHSGRTGQQTGRAHRQGPATNASSRSHVPGLPATSPTPAAYVPSSAPSSTAPASTPPSAPSSGPTSAPTSPPPTKPTSPPPTKPTNPAGDVAFTSTPPTDPRLGSTYRLSATGGSGGITFSIDPATSNAGTPNAACSLAGHLVTFDHAGRCVIAADQTSRTPVTHATQIIFVPRMSQTVTFTSTLPTDAAVEGTYDVSAESSSGRPVKLTTNAACQLPEGTLSEGTVTFLHASEKAGPCIITATQLGDTDLASATQSQAIDVAKGTQTIRMTPTASSALVGDTYTFSSDGGSNNPIVLAPPSTTEVCALSDNGTTVTFLNPGTCDISATQAGNDDWAPAMFATSVHVVAQPIDVDLTMSAAKSGDVSGLSGVTATVTGLPDGATATLTATADGTEAFHPADKNAPCTPEQQSTVWTCTVAAGDPPLLFAVNTQQGRQVTFVVEPDDPYTDSHQGDNTAVTIWTKKG